MNLFWERGYEGASLGGLTATTASFTGFTASRALIPEAAVLRTHWEALLRCVSEGGVLRTAVGIVTADGLPDLHGYFPAHDMSGAKCLISVADVV